jgi:mannosyltransferase
MGALYLLTLGLSISVWLIAVRAPLWADETLTYYVIKNGFWEIQSRQGWPGVPAPGYYYIIWLWTKIAGTSELSLRIPSILAMLAAVYLLYRASRELFGRDIAIITALVFCAHPIVIFASIDIRPYAFAMLAISAAIFLLVRLSDNASNWSVAALGIVAASIVYFQLLFGVILPALALCLAAIKMSDRRQFWRQCGIALVSFTVVLLPAIPGLLYMFRTRGAHVFDIAPKLLDLGWTIAPEWSFVILAGTILLAAVTRKIDLSSRVGTWRILLCASLALVPLLILYFVSAESPLHIFAFRYRLVAVPGIALCWGLILSRVESRLIKLAFCVVLSSVTAYHYFGSPRSVHHEHSWKYALEIAEKNASVDNAPVLICSDLIESDHALMPPPAAVKESALFPQLSYYKLSVPVVPLPRALNDQAVRIGLGFVQEAASRQKRFLALAYTPSYDTLHWLISVASPTHNVRILAQNEQTTGVVVLEFTPRSANPGSH